MPVNQDEHRTLLWRACDALGGIVDPSEYKITSGAAIGEVRLRHVNPPGKPTHTVQGRLVHGFSKNVYGLLESTIQKKTTCANKHRSSFSKKGIPVKLLGNLCGDARTHVTHGHPLLHPLTV